MAVTRHLPRRRRLMVGLVVLVTISLAGAAPASAASGRRCPDRTRSVFDRPAPDEAGGYLLDDVEFRRFGLPADAASGGPADINNRGEIVGPYVDAAGFNHGFRLDWRGCPGQVDYPDPPRTKNEAVGINDRGQIVGAYSAAANGRRRTP